MPVAAVAVARVVALGKRGSEAVAAERLAQEVLRLIFQLALAALVAAALVAAAMAAAGCSRAKAEPARAEPEAGADHPAFAERQQPEATRHLVAQAAAAVVALHRRSILTPRTGLRVEVRPARLVAPVAQRAALVDCQGALGQTHHPLRLTAGAVGAVAAAAGRMWPASTRGPPGTAPLLAEALAGVAAAVSTQRTARTTGMVVMVGMATSS